MRNNMKLRTLAVALLLGAAFVAVAAPQAAAHTCQGDDPARQCGDCRDSLFPHEHRYNDGKLYCKSRPLCTPHVCVAILDDLDVVALP